MRTAWIGSVAIVVVVAVCVLYALARHRQSHGDWPLGYSGTFTAIDSVDPSKNCTGKLYVNAAAEPRGMRREETCNGKTRILIWRQNGESCVLDPGQRLFWQAKSTARLMAGEGSLPRRIGTETIDGRTVEHYQQRMPSLQQYPAASWGGQQADVWEDLHLHTTVKIVTATSRYELTNIREGRQSASLFAIPDGYREIAPPASRTQNE